MGNIPTLQEVREYFKNVDTVETKTFKEKRKINHKKIWVDRDGDVLSEEKDTGYKFFLYDTNYKYAKILTHKEPTYTITKEQLLELENGFTLPKLKQWFPDVFDVKLEVGKWHYQTDSKALVNFQSGTSGYGFDFNGKWNDLTNHWSFKSHAEEWRLATEQEVFEALKNEAVKNYKIGQYIFDEWSRIQAPIERLDKFDFSYNTLFVLNNNNSKTALFCNGKWAEIIPTLTKKEAEEKLNCKIV